MAKNAKSEQNAHFLEFRANSDIFYTCVLLWMYHLLERIHSFRIFCQIYQITVIILLTHVQMRDVESHDF